MAPPQPTTSSTQKSVTEKQLLFKILIIGDVGTGKSSIVRRYVHNLFNQYYKATVGVDFAMKVLVWDMDTLLRLQIWDISGQDRFGNMTRVYYKDAHGALIVFDATRQATYDGALRWKADLDNKVCLANGKPVPTVLIANKCDIENKVTEDLLAEYCKKESFIGAFRASAKDNFGIEEGFKFLAGHIVATEKQGQYEIPLFQRDGNVRKLSSSMGTNGQRRIFESERTNCCP
uniref:Ras-related protein Rab n=1 Tax=Parascaris univalens TaxID=6257 RepID=A0A915BQE5_PARUN